MGKQGRGEREREKKLWHGWWAELTVSFFSSLCHGIPKSLFYFCRKNYPGPDDKQSPVLIKTSFVFFYWPVIMRGKRVGGYVVSCPLCRTPSIFAQSTQLSCSESLRMCDYNICVINHGKVTFCVVTPRCCRECSGDRFFNKLFAEERSSLWILLPEHGDRIQCPAFQMPYVCGNTS